MPKKLVTNSSASIWFLPIKFCIDIFNSVNSYVTNHLIICTFVCALMLVIYLTMYCPKAQELLSSLPYEQFIKHCKSQRMIIVYATLLEVAFELFMALVLAGVSVIITLWIAFEEITERKHDLPYESKRTKSNTQSQSLGTELQSFPE